VTRRALVLAAVASLALALATVELRRRLLPGSPTGSSPTPPSSSTNQPTAPGTAPTPGAPALSLLHQAAQALRQGGDAESDRARLHQLAAELAALGRERAVATLRAYLATGEDTSTHLGFTLGEGGLLTGAPTLRVFLLDLLERLDPAAAAEQARVILGVSVSADEWAVALRSLARGQPEARELLEAKTRELLRNPAWRNAPSTGWLEAFDVAVHLGGSGLVPDLANLMRPTDQRAISHAAFLALDRLATREPTAVLGALVDSPDLLAGREASRAGMMARADVRDETQRALLERYLLDPRRTPAELEALAGVYPNANSFVSANLLTAVPAPGSNGVRSHDLAARTVIEAWLAEPRFASVQPALRQMHERLTEFTRPP
jgi:hypothetical protein